MWSQTGHKNRTLSSQEPQSQIWKAFPASDSRSRFAYRNLRAVQDALWGKTEPFSTYRPRAIQKRESTPGPHAAFLGLKELSVHNDSRFNKAADYFASEHGLLGLYDFYYSPPVPPEGKALISPEAVVENARLRVVNPATEGLELLARMRDACLPPGWRSPGGKPLTEQLDRLQAVVAMPDEVSVIPKALQWPHAEFTPAPGGKSVPWTQTQSRYGALLVLDPANVWSTGVSVLERRESLFDWELALLDFPTPPDPNDPDVQVRSQALSRYLADQLTGVSPAPGVGGEGDLATGWRCNTLLESMYLMLYFDVRGSADLRECGLRDCTQYFRPGPHNALYCCDRHRNVATTRRSRGQKP